MIEQSKDFPDNVVAFICRGHVTKEDHEALLVPAVDKSLAGRGKLRLYHETAAGFAGIEPGAVWDDMKERRSGYSFGAA